MIISKDTYKFLNAEANKIKFKNEKPFPNIVIDNFFEKKIASKFQKNFLLMIHII